MEIIRLTCVLMRISRDFTLYHLENFKNKFLKKEEFWNIWRIYNIKHKNYIAISEGGLLKWRLQTLEFVRLMLREK